MSPVSVLDVSGTYTPREKALKFAIAAILFSANAFAATLFITNERGGTITVVDATSNKPIATLRVGVRPRGIVLAPDGKRLYVAVSHFRDKPRRGPDEIVAIDPKSYAIVKHYNAGTDPEGVGTDGAKIYVSNEDAGTASIVDAKSGKTLAALVVGTEPEGVAVSHDGKRVYITGETSNTVTVIDTKKNDVVA